MSGIKKKDPITNLHFMGSRVRKLKNTVFPQPFSGTGFFPQHLFFSFLVSYKRGLRSLSGFHSGKLVMLMSIFKVCSGRATNDLFSLPIHCQCESLFHELPTFDCMFCITATHQRESTRPMVRFAPKPVHRKPFKIPHYVVLHERTKIHSL